MSFLCQRVSRLPSIPFVYSKNCARLRGPVNSKCLHSSNSKNSAGRKCTEHLVPPIYVKAPPAWVRYAWPIIFANTLIMGSAIEITWNHWSTLVKDLEEIGEKNQAAAIATESSATKQPEETKETYHWEQRPTWQRAVFCGIYGAGWALSSIYLLKFRQTFATSIRLFRAKTLSLAQSSSSISTYEKMPIQRFIHISTASNPSGLSLAMSELTIQDGRNKTELVIRYASNAPTSREGKLGRGKRDYWYINLTDAQVSGSKLGDIINARDHIIWAWDGKIGNGGPVLTPDGLIKEEIAHTRVRGKK